MSEVSLGFTFSVASEGLRNERVPRDRRGGDDPILM